MDNWTYHLLAQRLDALWEWFLPQLGENNRAEFHRSFTAYLRTFGMTWDEWTEEATRRLDPKLFRKRIL